MDLCSLPDEMLASVLKYSNFETINKIRKLNQHLNTIIKRNKLDTVKLKCLSLSQSNGVHENFELSFQLTKLDRRFKKTLSGFADQYALETFVENYLKKFGAVRSFSLESFELRYSLIQMLQNYGSLFSGGILVSDCTVYARVEQLAAFLAFSKNSEVKQISWSVLGLIEYGADDERACTLIPVTNKLTLSPYGHSVTNETLEVLEKYPKMLFSFGKYTIRATGQRMVELAKKTFAYGHDFEYTLGRIKVNDREEAEHYANQMKLIEGVIVLVNYRYDENMCLVKKGNSKFFVDFFFDHPYNGYDDEDLRDMGAIF